MKKTLTLNYKKVLVELAKVNNDKWITIKPHGEDEKGRHLKLEGNESPAAAMKRQWGVDVNKKKKEKGMAVSAPLKYNDYTQKLSPVITEYGKSSERYGQFAAGYGKNYIYWNIIDKKTGDIKLFTYKNGEKGRVAYSGDLTGALKFYEDIEKEWKDKSSSVNYERRIIEIRSKFDAVSEKYKRFLNENATLDWRGRNFKQRYIAEAHQSAQYKELEDRFFEGNAEAGIELTQLKSTIEKDAQTKAEEKVEGYKKYILEKERLEEQKELAAKEYKNEMRIIAKETYAPKAIAGVTRGKEMSFEEANEGKVNPNYKKGGGYRTNCQSAVVAFFMRKRGFNVQVLPKTEGSALETLSKDFKEAWITPEGEVPTPINFPYYVNEKEFISVLDDRLEEKKDYVLRVKWKNYDYGHVVTLSKKDRKVTVYDPQSSRSYSDVALLKYLSEADFSWDRPQVIAIDDLSFNPEYMDKIVKKAE